MQLGSVVFSQYDLWDACPSTLPVDQFEHIEFLIEVSQVGNGYGRA